MNFRKKGWLQKYIDFRSVSPFPELSETKPLTGIYTEKALYRLLQPTGLLYGFPVELPFPEQFYPRNLHLSTSDKAQFIFLEGLFGSLFISNELQSVPASLQLKQFCSELAQYFGLQVPARARNRTFKAWFTPDTTLEELLEQHLQKMLNFKAGLTTFSVYFANSLLFLDIIGCVYHFLEKEEPAPVVLNQRELRVLALKLIAAAAHANGVIEKEESQIYFQFLRSANIEPEMAQHLTHVFETGITLEEIELPEMPWLIKRYLLELATLTILSDKDISIEEEHFLSMLCKRLTLPQDEIEKAVASLQTFLVMHEPSLHFFKDITRFTFATERLRQKVAALVSQNKSRFMEQLRNRKQLFEILHVNESSLSSNS